MMIECLGNRPFTKFLEIDGFTSIFINSLERLFDILDVYPPFLNDLDGPFKLIIFKCFIRICVKFDKVYIELEV